VTTEAAARQWWARGGAFVLGRVVPGLLAVIGFAGFGGVFAILIDRGWAQGAGPSLFPFLIALLATWLLWKVMRTVWLITLVEDTFTFWSTGKQWTLEPGEVSAVKGDAYNQFLVILSSQGKIWLWAHLEDRQGLLAAIRKANPTVEFDRYVDR
jgi:hypothetical protein